MEDLTESEISDIDSWMTEYMEGAFVEGKKGKVEETKEKRLRKTQGKTKVSFCRTVVETEAEAPLSDVSTSELKLGLNKMSELQVGMKSTNMKLKRLCVKVGSSSPWGVCR